MEILKVREQMDNWNDDRLDELAQDVKDGFNKVDARFEKVDARFEKVEARFEKVEGEMKAGFAKVEGETKEGFAKVEGETKAGFAELRAANERLYRMLLGSAVVIIAALIGVPTLGG